MTEPFHPNPDLPRLRAHLVRLQSVERLSQEKIRGLVAKFLGRSDLSGVITRGSLQRFMRGGDIKNIGQLRDIWNWVIAHPVYGNGLRGEPVRPGMFTGGTSEDEYRVLMEGLSRFFVPDARLRATSKLEAIRRGIAGDYVMYRPFMGPLEEPILPNGLIRATHFRIYERNEVIVCEEIQNIPESIRGEAHIQRNDGILFSYGDRVFWIMRGQGDISFKVGVVENMQNWIGPGLDWFKGRLFVVSNNAIYPTVRLCCVRNRGDLQTGYLLPHEITHPEARAVFKDLPPWKGDAR